MENTIFKTLTPEELEQNQIDFHNFMQAGNAGAELQEEYFLFGNSFYDDNEPFI